MKKGKLSFIKSIPFIISAIAISIALFVAFDLLFSSKSVDVYLGIKSENKTYLFTHTSHRYLSKNKEGMPPINKEGSLIIVNNHVYLEPKKLYTILDLASKNYTLLNKKGKNQDGYVIVNKEICYTYSTNKEEGEKLGEQIIKNKIEIKNKKGDTFYIKWTKYKAEENCIITPVMVARRNTETNTIYSTEDVVVVKLKTILDFLNNGADYEYDIENEILYIIQP